jgi:hypothetical protein
LLLNDSRIGGVEDGIGVEGYAGISTDAQQRIASAASIITLALGIGAPPMRFRA